MTPEAILLLTTLAAAPSQAGQELPVSSSAGWMLQGCRAVLDRPDESSARQGMCIGSIATLLFLGDALPDEFRVCRPRGAVIYDAVRIVVQAIEKQPTRMGDQLQYARDGSARGCVAVPVSTAS